MASAVSKPKTQRGKRHLLNREPKLEENTKKVMLIRGGKTSEIVTHFMKDIEKGTSQDVNVKNQFSVKKPNAVMFHKKNILRPFEDQTSLEFFSQRNDTSLMLFGSHSKKRPHNVVFGTFYDFHILDMFELGIEKFKPSSDFKEKGTFQDVDVKFQFVMQSCGLTNTSSKCWLLSKDVNVKIQSEKVTAGTKPCILFSGEEFYQKHEYRRLKTFLTDFWRGEKTNNIRLQGLEHIIQFTVVGDKILLRNYRTQLKKSGLKTPRVELEEIGPSVDFVLRRTHLAADSLYKEALRQPKALKPKKKKNIGTDVFGTKTGRIHMQKQDLGTLQTRKMKGLKRGKFTDSQNDGDGGESKRTKVGEE